MSGETSDIPIKESKTKTKLEKKFVKILKEKKKLDEKKLKVLEDDDDILLKRYSG